MAGVSLRLGAACRGADQQYRHDGVYLCRLWRGDVWLPAGNAAWIAIGVVGGLSAVNLLGVAFGKTLQNVLSGAKVLGLLGIVLAGVVFGQIGHLNPVRDGLPVVGPGFGWRWCLCFTRSAAGATRCLSPPRSASNGAICLGFVLGNSRDYGRLSGRKRVVSGRARLRGCTGHAYAGDRHAIGCRCVGRDGCGAVGNAFHVGGDKRYDFRRIAGICGRGRRPSCVCFFGVDGTASRPCPWPRLPFKP